MDTIYYYTPVVLLATFATMSLLDICSVAKPTESRHLSRRRKLLFIISLTVTSSFICRGAEQITYLSDANQSCFVHSLSETLFWLTLSLTIISQSTVPLLPYLTTWLLSFFVEAFIICTSYASSKRAQLESVTTTQFALQCLSVVLHLVLLSVVLSTLFSGKSIQPSHETEPLLRNEPVNTLPSIASHDSGDDSVSEPGSETVDSDVEIKALRKAKLQNVGSWAAYLATFKVFVPFVIPTNDLRMQLLVLVLIIDTLLMRVLHVLGPYQLGLLVDKIHKRGEVPWTTAIIWISIEIAVSNSTGLGGLNDIIFPRLGAWSRQQIYLGAFDKVMSLSMNFHDSKESGEVIKGIEQAGALSSLFRVLLEDIIPGFLDTLVAVWYVGHLLDVYASHVVLCVIIAFVFTIIHGSKLATASRREESHAERNESKILYETISNWPIVSYFNRKSYESSRLGAAAQRFATATVKVNDVYALLFFLQEAASLTGRFAVSILAMYRISNGVSSVGSFVALQNYWETITMPLYNLGYSYRKVASDMIDAERLMQLFDTEITVKDRPNAYNLDISKGEVTFENVKFAYEGRGDTIDKLNIRASVGQTIALVGETGSGKSTIFKLLMRFYDISSGKITIDTQNIEDVTISSLRDVFGFVPQDSVLFNTTILENVRYGRLDATIDEIREACRAACIHGKIMSFPGGYMSKVGERGVKMSGGERQRIAIARVLLKNPRIVLLDEATSAMDSQTEAKIQRALKTLIRGRTAFVIAHRLSTIVEADQILVLDGGRIVEKGTHNELLEAGGRYFLLWSKQSAFASGSGEETSRSEPEIESRSGVS